MLSGIPSEILNVIISFRKLDFLWEIMSLRDFSASRDTFKDFYGLFLKFSPSISLEISSEITTLIFLWIHPGIPSLTALEIPPGI